MRIGAVHPQQIDFREAHMKGKLGGKGQNRCLYHTVGKDVSSHLIPFAGDGVDIGGVQRPLGHFMIGFLNGK